MNQNSQNTSFEWFFVQTVSATFLQKSIKMKQFLFTWFHKVSLWIFAYVANGEKKNLKFIRVENENLSK